MREMAQIHSTHNRRHVWFFIRTLAILFIFFSQSSQAAQPNILLIVADDLGYSDLGCYGGEIDTLNLDALAAGGVRLTQFYTMGRCCPSRASILTGQYPHRVGLGHMTQDINQPGYRGQVSDQAQTIAQVLKPSGYRSFIAGKWHLGTPDPTQHGFEEFYGTLVSAKRFFDPDHLIRLPKDRKKIEYPEGKFYATDAVTDHALSFLKQAESTPEKPWFLYLAYNAPHFPLHAQPEDIAKYKGRFHEGWDVLRKQRLDRMKKLGIVTAETKLTPRSPYWNYGETKTGTNPSWNSLPENRRQDLARRMAVYAAMVDRMDQQIGRIFARLKDRDEFDNTLIVFLSDNGACAEWDPYGFDVKSSNQNILYAEEDLDKMGSASTYSSFGSGWANACNTPWRLYKHYNHEGGINSPCIIHWPAGLGDLAGKLDHQPAHIIDLMPTAIAVANANYKGALNLPGANLVTQLGTPTSQSRTLYFEHEGNRGIRTSDWKLVSLRDQPWELYNFKSNRTELDNLASQYPDQVKELSAKWETWAKINQVTPLPKNYQVGYLRKTR